MLSGKVNSSAPLEQVMILAIWCIFTKFPEILTQFGILPELSLEYIEFQM